MNRREWNVAKATATLVRHEAGLKAAPPGPDSYCRGRQKVTLEEMRELRVYVRAALAGDYRTMRRFGGPPE